MKIFKLLPAVALLTALFAAPAFADDHDKKKDKDKDKKHKHYSSYESDHVHVNLGVGVVQPRPYYGHSSTVIVERERPVYYGDERRVYVERSGYSGSSVGRDVQRGLARRGYYHGPIDGDIGPGSRSAIRAYQADHGVAPTGQIDRGLVESLR